MTDFLRPENFDPPNGTEIIPKLSTFTSNEPHTETHSGHSDQHHSQSGGALPWFQNNLRSKGNHSSENIHNVDTNTRAGFPENVNFKHLPYDSRVTGRYLPNEHNIHRNQPNEQWMNNFYNQRYFPTQVPHYDHQHQSYGHIQQPHQFYGAPNSWKPASFGTHYPNSNHDSGKINPLKSNHPNNDIYHGVDATKYDRHHPSMHHQIHNAHSVNSYHKLNNFIGETHHTAKDFNPHNKEFGNSHSSHIESGSNFGYPIYNPLNFKGSYHEIIGPHHVGSGHDNFVGMARPETNRFSFESMLTKEDLESLIFDFYEPGNIFTMDGGDFLNDRIGYSQKRSAGRSNGFKHFLDKFIKKTEHIVSKWGPKIEKVSDAVGLVFGFLKYVSNLPVFHLHR